MDNSAPTVITAIEQVTPEWLTATFRREGVLDRGEVVRISPRSNDAFNLTIAHLDLTFSDDAGEDAPKQLLLKRNRSEG